MRELFIETSLELEGLAKFFGVVVIYVEPNVVGQSEEVFP